MTFAIIGLAILAIHVLIWRERRRLGRLMASRPHDSICTFARAFPRPERDPILLRATWDTLRAQTDFPIPLRPNDRLLEDLQIDGENLDDLLVLELAPLTHRSLTDCAANPWYGKIHTIRDLISYLRHQPAL